MNKASAITSSLSEVGFSVVPAANLEEFKSICSMLGTIKQEARVEIQEGKKEYKWIPDAVPFHTDNPKMAVIGFYCVRQDEQDGASLLMDARKILERMTESEKALMANVKLKMPNSEERYPILIQQPQPQIFYLPFFWKQAASLEKLPEEKAMMKFHGLVLEENIRGNFESVRLTEGNALFVNNQIMLHARRSLPNNSHRLLVRILIQQTCA